MKGASILFIVLVTTAFTPILMDSQNDYGEEDDEMYVNTEEYETNHDNETNSTEPNQDNDENEETNDDISTTTEYLETEHHSDITDVTNPTEKHDVNDDVNNAKRELLKGKDYINEKDYINSTHRNIDGMIIDITSPMEFLNDTCVKINGKELDVNKVFPNFYNLSANGERKNDEIGDRSIKVYNEFEDVFNSTKDFINATHRKVDGMIVDLNKTYSFINETHLNVNGRKMSIYKLYPKYPQIKVPSRESTRMQKKTSSMSVSTIQKSKQMMAWYKQNIYNRACGYQCLNPCVGATIGLVLPVVGIMGSGFGNVNSGMASMNQQMIQQSETYKEKKCKVCPKIKQCKKCKKQQKCKKPKPCPPAKTCSPIVIEKPIPCPKIKCKVCPKEKICPIPKPCELPPPCRIPPPCPSRKPCPIQKPCSPCEICVKPKPCAVTICKKRKPCPKQKICPKVKICPLQKACPSLTCPSMFCPECPKQLKQVQTKIQKKKVKVVKEVDIECEYTSTSSSVVESSSNVCTAQTQVQQYCKSCYLMKKCQCLCSSRCKVGDTNIKMLEKSKTRLRTLPLNTNNTDEISTSNITDSNISTLKPVNIYRRVPRKNNNISNTTKNTLETTTTTTNDGDTKMTEENIIKIEDTTPHESSATELNKDLH